MQQTVTVYYGYIGDGIKVEHAAGQFPAGPSATPITTASLTFKAFRAGVNGDDEIITDLTLGSNEPLAKDGTVVITPTSTA